MILKGQPFSSAVISSLSKSKLPSKKLVVICISDDKVSSVYVGKKVELANKLGVDIVVERQSEDISLEDLEKKIDELNMNENVGGIIIQMPIPERFDRMDICSRIAPEKDIDGFLYITQANGPTLPPTVMAIDGILDFYGLSKENKKVLIVGKGFLVGRPLYNYYRDLGMNVEVIDEKGGEYFEKIKSADIVVLATGGQGKFDQDAFKDGSIVIDASTVASDSKVVGDLMISNPNKDFSYSPVPGGVGPVTVAMLFVNFYLLNGSPVEGFGLIKKN